MAAGRVALFLVPSEARDRYADEPLSPRRKKTEISCNSPFLAHSFSFQVCAAIPGLRELDVQEAQTLNTGIQRLRSNLGTASFARFDGFARSVYHATPGKLVLIHLTDDVIHGRFFEYLAVLNGMAGSVTAQQEEAKRQNELRAAGLAEKDWALLVKVAKDYQELFDPPYKPAQEQIGVGSGYGDYGLSGRLCPDG
ncbi:MAG TPA: hypothetical protein VGH51_12410 [Candidatus Angelobacter sp.]